MGEFEMGQEFAHIQRRMGELETAHATHSHGVPDHEHVAPEPDPPAPDPEPDPPAPEPDPVIDDTILDDPPKEKVEVVETSPAREHPLTHRFW